MHDVLFTSCVVGVDLNLNAACPSYLCKGDDIPDGIAKLYTNIHLKRNGRYSWLAFTIICQGTEFIVVVKRTREHYFTLEKGRCSLYVRKYFFLPEDHKCVKYIVS